MRCGIAVSSQFEIKTAKKKHAGQNKRKGLKKIYSLLLGKEIAFIRTSVLNDQNRNQTLRKWNETDRLKSKSTKQTKSVV